MRGLIPKELKFYAFDSGLVITAADSRRYKVRLPDYSAEPYQPADEEQFYPSPIHGDAMERRLSHAATFSPSKHLSTAVGSAFTQRRKRPTRARTGSVENWRIPASVIRQSAGVRRSFWTARIGRTKEFSEGSHDRLFDVSRVPDGPDFLDGGFLVRQGTRQPLTLETPAGLLVMHRTRLDEEGRAALTRLDRTLHEKWTAKMPFIDLRNRFEFPDRLLMYGLVQVTEKGVTGSQESIAALDLRDGRTRAWNVTLDRSIPAAELE